ncbi:hypothetical protein BaRGS_00014623 [Batillaria attramentaria]|uniref:Uncharacterized protein n=1 Tax=Batillaria attramentaria TaxID=370345 RepID=A0ABD0L3U9_9CAEN
MATSSPPTPPSFISPLHPNTSPSPREQPTYPLLRAGDKRNTCNFTLSRGWGRGEEALLMSGEVHVLCGVVSPGAARKYFVNTQPRYESTITERDDNGKGL